MRCAAPRRRSGALTFNPPFVGGLTAVLVLLAACSQSPPATSSGAQDINQGKGPSIHTPDVEGGTEPSQQTKKRGGAKGGKGKQKGMVGGKGGGGLANATAAVTDPPSDAQKSGSPPSFAEIMAASVEGLGRSLRLTLALAGDVPEKMPDDKTFMIVAWNIGGDKKHKSMGFSAQADTEGWKVTAGSSTGEPKKFTGSFEIVKNRVVITIPWSFVGGPRRFEWSTASTWSSTSEGKSNSSADNIPNARFPG